jgi:hypothetical protein
MTRNDESLMHQIARKLNAFWLCLAFQRLYKLRHLIHFSRQSLRKTLEKAGIKNESSFLHSFSAAAVDFESRSAVSDLLLKQTILLLFLSGRFFDGSFPQAIVCRNRL